MDVYIGKQHTDNFECGLCKKFGCFRFTLSNLLTDAVLWKKLENWKNAEADNGIHRNLTQTNKIWFSWSLKMDRNYPTSRITSGFEKQINVHLIFTIYETL